jgi:hypothetical protein
VYIAFGHNVRGFPVHRPAVESSSVAVTVLLAEEVPMQVSSSPSGRRLERVSATIPLSLLLEREDSRHDAYTVDISPNGARIRSDFVLTRGQMIGIVASGDSGEAIPSRVVWVEQSPAVGSLAGLEFLGPLPA